MADDEMLRLGEDAKLFVDTADSWSSPVWEEVKYSDELSGDRGIMSAEFAPRGADVGHRRSKRRNPSLTLKLMVKPGDAAFDKFQAAIDDRVNGGDEILHLAIVDGEIDVAGNEIRQNDFVVVSASDEYPTGEGWMIDVELRRAIDSSHAATIGVTAAPGP